MCLGVVEIQLYPNFLFLWSRYSLAPNRCTTCCSHSTTNPCAPGHFRLAWVLVVCGGGGQWGESRAGRSRKEVHL